MENLRIAGANMVLGQDQEWSTIHVRAEVMEITGRGEVPCMRLALAPTPAELIALAAGQPLIITVIGKAWPPLAVQVGDPNPPPVDPRNMADSNGR